jgi:hypothetical protein
LAFGGCDKIPEIYFGLPFSKASIHGYFPLYFGQLSISGKWRAGSKEGGRKGGVSIISKDTPPVT